MKIFLDCSDPDLIASAYETGLIDGVTTNPSLMLKAGKDPKEVIKEISESFLGTHPYLLKWWETLRKRCWIWQKTIWKSDQTSQSKFHARLKD